MAAATEARQGAAPTSADKVKDMLSAARAEHKAAALEASKSPAQNPQEKARRERDRREHMEHVAKWAAKDAALNADLEMW